MTSTSNIPIASSASSEALPNDTNSLMLQSSPPVPVRAKAINPRLKEQILREVALAKEPLTVIAKRHNIKVDRIYHWRMIERKMNLAKSHTAEAKNFHEVEVERDEPLAHSSFSSLQKVELEFDGYSISIKGRIELDKFIKACKLLAS